MNQDNTQGYSLTKASNQNTINIDINLQDEVWQAQIKQLNDLIINISEYVFEIMELTKYATNIEYSIILANDNFIQSLNKQYRGKDSPTNSLSFPAQEIQHKNLHNLSFHDGFAILGDVIFSYETIKNEAQMQGKTFNDHFVHLLVHSLLHLFGYDHIVEEEAIEMEKLEVEILSHFKIKSPYEE